jgi:hypothetical protein
MEAIMRAKSFFYVSLGILALAAAYHLGATSAAAQAPGNPVVATFGGFGVVTASGDVYQAATGGGPWKLESNVFAGGATPTVQKSWGQVKVDHR